MIANKDFAMFINKCHVHLSLPLSIKVKSYSELRTIDNIHCINLQVSTFPVSVQFPNCLHALRIMSSTKSSEF